jgi:hypothetical protein
MPRRYGLLRALLLAEFLLPGACCAYEIDPPAEYEQEIEAARLHAIAGIPSLLKAYAETIGCQFSMNGSDVVRSSTHDIGVTKGGDDEVFVALFGVDEGCSGGNAMMRPVLAVLHWGGYMRTQLFVDVEFSSTAQAAGFPQNMDRLYKVGKELRFKAREYRPEDALCCASKRMSGRVVWASDHWEAR